METAIWRARKIYWIFAKYYCFALTILRSCVRKKKFQTFLKHIAKENIHRQYLSHTFPIFVGPFSSVKYYGMHDFARSRYWLFSPRPKSTLYLHFCKYLLSEVSARRSQTWTLSLDGNDEMGHSIHSSVNKTLKPSQHLIFRYIDTLYLASS